MWTTWKGVLRTVGVLDGVAAVADGEGRGTANGFGVFEAQKPKRASQRRLAVCPPASMLRRSWAIIGPSLDISPLQTSGSSSLYQKGVRDSIWEKKGSTLLEQRHRQRWTCPKMGHCLDERELEVESVQQGKTRSRWCFQRYSISETHSVQRHDLKRSIVLLSDSKANTAGWKAYLSKEYRGVLSILYHLNA